MSTRPATDAPAAGAVAGPGRPAAAAPRYRIGVDGGGSGTRARLVDAQGRVLGEGHAGPSGLTQGIQQAWLHIGQAIDQAIARAFPEAASRAPRSHADGAAPAPVPPPVPANTALGLGLAGANSRGLRERFLQANPGYALLRLQSDADTTLLGAHGTAPGAVLAVGTGSVGLARLPDGRMRRVGGWGFPSGDDGSGGLLGLRAVNHTQRVLDGMQPAGPLADAVLQTCGGSAEALLEWCCSAGQNRFASLAPLVFDCAAHDPAAHAFLEDAARCIAQMAHALEPAQTLPLVLLGSIGRRLATRLSPTLQERLVLPRGDAMDGALLLLTLCEESP